MSLQQPIYQQPLLVPLTSDNASIGFSPSAKACSKCGVSKPLSQFHKRASQSDGRCAQCKECRKRYQASYDEQNREKSRASARRYYRENKDRHQAGIVRWRLKRKAKHLIIGCRHRARKLGIPFDLDKFEAEIQRRIDAGKCELTGTPIVIFGSRSPFAPSIDRIRPKDGYVYSNIRIVSWLANCALGTWGEATLRDVMQKWLSA